MGLFIEHPELAREAGGLLSGLICNLAWLAVALWPPRSQASEPDSEDLPERFDEIDRGDDWPEQRSLVPGP